MYCTDNVDSLHIIGQTFTDLCHKILIDTL